MSRKLKFIWIDDDPKREVESRNIEERFDIEVNFIEVKGGSLNKVLEEILSQNEPDLILMDHKLQDDIDQALFNTGSTASEILREKWPSCPIVCITGVKIEDVDSYKRSLYEDVFSVENISKYYLTLISIAKSFIKLRSKPLDNVEGLLSLLKAPSEDKKRLSTILPDTLKKDYSDPSLPVFISRWVRKTLIAKPGFLYDRLWTATLLGIKEGSLVKVEELFTKAKYRGIFSDDSNERWWQSSLRKILSSEVDDPELIYPWEQGRKLAGITEKDHSKCYASGEAFPETVAFIDETATIRAPMRLKYTVPHPQFEESLFFEEIRMMKAEE